MRVASHLMLAIATLSASPVAARQADARTVTWCPLGVKLSVPTAGRDLETSMSGESLRLQNYRIEELEPLGDGFYALRPGDFFLEASTVSAEVAAAVRREMEESLCDGAANPVGDGIESDQANASIWCRVDELVELGGEASYTHVALLRIAEKLLSLRLDGSQLPVHAPQAVFESVAEWQCPP
ncbi:MAG: hypothetical protein DWQ36_20375 [Acidobacteria bacterium]|nr:MAG: hypothetical protein DWQ30_20800 [Acidobacteriota bacterium]REK03226.1 MAG: hypothetical protein DWQ36_20375 [Acidobacteriota bacterium]